MNKIVLFIVMIFSFSLIAQIQSGEITYKVKDNFNIEIIKDTLETPNEYIKDFVIKDLEVIKRTVPFLSYLLRFTKGEAYFEMPVQMINDNGLDVNYASENASVKGIYYTNIEDQITLNQAQLYDILWLIQTDLGELDWNIEHETKKIKGYQCYKATANIISRTGNSQNMVAWFTPELPFQFGPVGFGGLPGMILGLQKGNYYFYADKISLFTENIYVKRPVKGKLVSEETFLKESQKIFEEKTKIFRN